MEKPITLLINDTREDLIRVIETSQLPPIVLLPIIKDIYMELNNLTASQIEKEKKEYEEANTEV